MPHHYHTFKKARVEVTRHLPSQSLWHIHLTWITISFTTLFLCSPWAQKSLQKDWEILLHTPVQGSLPWLHFWATATAHVPLPFLSSLILINTISPLAQSSPLQYPWLKSVSICKTFQKIYKWCCSSLYKQYGLKIQTHTVENCKIQ